MTRKICLVGFAETSREWGNEQPDDVEIWGLNEGHRFLKRWDLWFQMHPRDWRETEREAYYAHRKGKKLHLEPNSRDAYGRNSTHTDWLAKCDVPVIMQTPDERIPTSVAFPMDAATEMFGTLNGNHSKKNLYATSTMAYMLIYALMQPDITEIRIAGIELLIGTEYFWQRACVEYYLGLAMGKGINVVFSPYGCSLLNAPRYAIDEDSPAPKDFTEGMELRFRVGSEGHKNTPVVLIEEDAREAVTP